MHTRFRPRMKRTVIAASMLFGALVGSGRGLAFSATVTGAPVNYNVTTTQTRAAGTWRIDLRPPGRRRMALPKSVSLIPPRRRLRAGRSTLIAVVLAGCGTNVDTTSEVQFASLASSLTEAHNQVLDSLRAEFPGAAAPEATGPRRSGCKAADQEKWVQQDYLSIGPASGESLMDDIQDLLEPLGAVDRSTDLVLTLEAKDSDSLIEVEPSDSDAIVTVVSSTKCFVIDQ